MGTARWPWLPGPAWWALVLQAAGSAANLLAAVLVAWHLGLAAQGEFALLRSWTDALTAALALGLPQGLLHLLYRESVAPEAVRRAIWRTAGLLALGMGGVAGVVALSPSAAWPAAFGARQPLVVVALAVPLFVLHRLWRSLVLKTHGVVPLAALTALPSLAILAGVAALGVWPGRWGFEAVLLASAALSAAVGAWLVHGKPLPSPSGSAPGPWPRGVLWSVSLQTWAQGLLSALLPAGLLSLGGLLGASLAEVGVVSLGLQVYQVFAVLATYAAPVIYDRVAAREGGLDARRFLRQGWSRTGWPVLALALGAAVAGPWLLAGAWPVAAHHQAGMTAMALAGLAALAVRVGWTLMQAQGRIQALSWQAGWRLALALLLAGAGMQVAAASLAVPLALLAVELLSLLQLWHGLGRRA